MKRRHLAPLLLCGLTALPAWSQDKALPSAGTDTPQAQYKDSVSVLDQVAQIDAYTRKFSSSIQAMLRHTVLKDLPPTRSEKEVANVLLGNDETSSVNTAKGKDGKVIITRGFKKGGLQYIASSLNSKLKAMPGISFQPRFVTAERKIPLSTQKLGCIDMYINHMSNTLIDVPVSAGKMSLENRIKIIQRRLQTTATADPLFWTQLSVANKNGQWVVATPHAPNGFLITADPQFSRVRHTTPQRLAQDLIADIRSSFDPEKKAVIGGRGVEVGEASIPDPDPNDPGAAHRAAVQWWERGSSDYTRGDTESAASDYSKAIQLDPGFTPAYKTLASLYIEQNRLSDARALLNKALEQDNLDAQDKQDLNALLGKTGP